MARKCHVTAPAGVEEEREPRDDEAGGDDADIRFDEVDALAPVRQVERHQRGGREAVPDDEVVGVLDEGDDDAEEIQQRHEEGDDLLVPEPEERSFKRGEQEEERGADEEVEADLRHVPVLVVRPGVEQREGAAPGEPCEEVRQGSPREERNARAVLHEHEREHDGQEDGDEVLRAHVLSDVDVEGDQADVVDARCRQPTDETVLSLGRKLHAITSVPGCLGQPSI